MGNVNSQGLTWLEWYRAAGFLMSALDKMATDERDGLRQAWKAGVDPQSAEWTGPANYRPQVNSQGLTWLEWRNAAGYSVVDFGGHDGMIVWGELRNAWKAGVDPAEYRNEPTQMYADEDMFPPGA